MAMIGLFADTHENAETLGANIILKLREIYVDYCKRDNGKAYTEIYQGDGEHTPLESTKIFSQKDYEDALSETQESMAVVKAFEQNMVNATSAANASATKADEATTQANAAAKACEGIVDGLNTMVDTVTGVACVLSMEDGLLTIREAD